MTDPAQPNYGRVDNNRKNYGQNLRLIIRATTEGHTYVETIIRRERLGGLLKHYSRAA